jgi:hypothetical protein
MDYIPSTYPLASITKRITAQRDIVWHGTKSIPWPAGHSIESTVRYLGIEVDDAIEIAEKIDI